MIFPSLCTTSGGTGWSGHPVIAEHEDLQSSQCNDIKESRNLDEAATRFSWRERQVVRQLKSLNHVEIQGIQRTGGTKEKQRDRRLPRCLQGASCVNFTIGSDMVLGRDISFYWHGDEANDAVPTHTRGRLSDAPKF